jgi:hypothetical protein
MTQTQIEAICREENQVLYYEALDILGKQQYLARYLAQNSSKFHSVNSWAMFLSLTMWSKSNDKPVKPRYTMQQDFNKLAKELINANV